MERIDNIIKSEVTASGGRSRKRMATVVFQLILALGGLAATVDVVQACSTTNCSGNIPDPKCGC